MKKILLLEGPHAVADKVFADANIQVDRVEGSLAEDDLIKALQGYEMVGIRSKTKLTKRVFEECPELICAGTYTIGTNQIDVQAAAQHGVAAFNAPYSNTRSVAELAISEIIALARQLPVRNSHLQQADWQKSAKGSHEVRGKTLGIIGYSSTGTQLSILAEAMGMRVQFYDLAKKLPIGNAKQCNSMEEALEGADFVSLHVDGRPSNEKMFGAKEIAMMKPGSKLLNLSRGFVVDVEALADALDSGHLGGCAVDVFPEEPLKNGDPFESPLIGKENTILTPHIGGSTLEAQEDIGWFVSGKICNYMANGETVMSINMPNLSLEPTDSTRYRMSVIHKNIPGVMGHINQLMAEANINVEGQILGTNGQVGYVIADISSELPESAVDEIRAMEPTIRCRVMPLQEIERDEETTVN
ncbi:MAG: phosphoglycerate dehydrogenase [Mobiluncus porci]|uniref:phosphoglycerate dehydrogenase n=1 Tax=Mobiluncus porci TaxID=2652278 RepID=UPI0023EFD6DE|nr:phosphoglycerate dehydrogenase [Mobiluncus porci]MDD7542317.1 phosphoglycerate dehydrogenase [Mobiluncus porci]MDY5749116.1 phosphoglycerate dehydrogenase [Mobiluncus porci]